MFHLRQDLFFGRCTNGAVRIIKFRTTPAAWPSVEDPIYNMAIFDITVAPAEWASVVASVCADGETPTRYLDAMTVHMSAARPPVHHRLELNDANGTKDRMSGGAPTA